MEWRQCPKKLWLKVHRPELIDKDADTKHAFKVGYEIGVVARVLYPGGVLIDTRDLREALQLTRQWLASRVETPLYEATFERDGLLIQADLLLPEADGYRMIEVKSATSVKDYYLEDVAIQRWVAGNAVRLTGVDVAHVDSKFVYPGGDEYRGLLNIVSVNAKTEKFCEEIPTWVSTARDVLEGSEPVIKQGKQCSTPFECPFKGYCATDKPKPEFPLTGLPHLSGGRRAQLEEQGIWDLRDVPDEFPLSDDQKRVRRITRNGVPELLPEAARKLSAYPWPRYYLDFETVSMAVPIWAGTRPYQKLPVQWSCHIETQEGRLDHKAFLAEGVDDPRRAFANSLVEVVGNSGAIFVYNQSFELARIKELASDFPDVAESLHAIAGRVIDFLPLTRDNYYHPKMLGSRSIKDVLPTIPTDLDYKAMVVGDGGAAEAAWLEILHPSTPEEQRQRLRRDLAAYCAVDTKAMVDLAHFLVQRSNS